MRKVPTSEKPSYLVVAERQEAALKQKQERLRQSLAAGKITEKDFRHKQRLLLERQVINELELKALREVASWESDE